MRAIHVLKLTLLLALPLAADAAQPGWVHPFHAAQAAKAPDELLLAVEIPAGSFTKYEIGEDGLLHVDRFLAMPMAYPANYGSMPRTLAGDERVGEDGCSVQHGSVGRRVRNDAGEWQAGRESDADDPAVD